MHRQDHILNFCLIRVDVKVAQIGLVVGSKGAEAASPGSVHWQERALAGELCAHAQFCPCQKVEVLTIVLDVKPPVLEQADAPRHVLNEI